MNAPRVPGAGPRRTPTGYLPSLDGWRGLAILFVLMDHDEPWRIGRYSNASFHEYGGWGVFIFFAISGLLVCTRILQDEELQGKFHIGGFYIRRFFRIQPAATVFVAVIALLSLLRVTHERPSALAGALFMYQNYLFNAADPTGFWFMTGHFWTLAVEEHFYLLLSLLLFAFHRRRATVFCLAAALVYFWQRCVIHFALYNPQTAPRRTEMMLNFLLLPALFAILLTKPAVRRFSIRVLTPWLVFSATLAVKLCMELVDPVSINDRGSLVAIAVHHPPVWFYSFGFWVVATVLHPASLTTRLLEWHPLRFLGRLSYSLYLWHPLFLFPTNPRTAIHAHWLLFLCERPWRYVGIVTAALLSYYWVEKPFIRLGHRIAPPATPGHRDLLVTNQNISPPRSTSQVVPCSPS